MVDTMIHFYRHTSGEKSFLMNHRKKKIKLLAIFIILIIIQLCKTPTHCGYFLNGSGKGILFQSQVETSQTILETQKPKFQNQVPAPESKVLNFVSFLCVTIVASIQLNSVF